MNTKKIIFLASIGLLITGGVWAIRPIPSPINLPVEQKERERVEERIREIEAINKEIDVRITEVVFEAKERKEIEIKDVEKIEEKIKELGDRAKEIKEIEKEIENKEGTLREVERRITFAKEEIILIEKAKPEAIKKEIERAGIDMALIDAEEIKKGIEGFRKDVQETLRETEERKENIQRDLGEITQRRERIKEETRIVREELIPLVPLIKEVEREVEEKRAAQVAKIIEIRQDSDEDGLTDEEEIRLGTDILNPDTDGDGFLDGIEVKRNFNPLNSMLETEAIYQDPREVAPKKIDVYIVENVRVITLPDARRAVEITGRGLPNSYVTISIFSRPIVVSVKTDGQGRWSYILEDPEDGKHEVFVAVTNNKGNIEARSLVFPFVLAGENVAVLPYIAKVAAMPIEEIKIDYLIITLLIITIGLIAGLVIIKILTKKREEKKIGA